MTPHRSFRTPARPRALALALAFVWLALVGLTGCIAISSNTTATPSANVQSVSTQPAASGGVQSEQHGQTAVNVEDYHGSSQPHFPTLWQLLILLVCILLLLIWLVGRRRRRKREEAAARAQAGVYAGTPGAEGG